MFLLSLIMSLSFFMGCGDDKTDTAAEESVQE